MTIIRQQIATRHVATSLFCLPFFVCFDRSLNALKGLIHDLQEIPASYHDPGMSKDDGEFMDSEEVLDNSWNIPWKINGAWSLAPEGMEKSFTYRRSPPKDGL